MKIHKIGIRNYRSIGDQPIELDLCKRANILIGPNNAGKSNVLTAIQRIGKDKIQWDTVKDTDRHKRQATTKLDLSLKEFGHHRQSIAFRRRGGDSKQAKNSMTLRLSAYIHSKTFLSTNSTN
jgi:predicted ATP-dependent endonuclease of OLD family